MGYCISFLRETVRYGRFIDTQCLFLLEIAATESLFFCDSAKQIQIMVASLCNSCLHIPDFIATYCTILSTFIPIFLPIVHVLLLLAEVHLSGFIPWSTCLTSPCFSICQLAHLDAQWHKNIPTIKIYFQTKFQLHEEAYGSCMSWILNFCIV